MGWFGFSLKTYSDGSWDFTIGNGWLLLIIVSIILHFFI